MTKTDNFLKHMVAKGVVTEVQFLASGYDIKVGSDVVSVRLKGSNAVIWNHKNPALTEIKSSRLDDVLHRYIVLSCMGKTSGKTKLGDFTGVTFVPQAVVNNRVIFKDALNRSWIAGDNTAKSVMSFFENAKNVSAEDTLILLNGFEPFNKDYRFKIESSFVDADAEIMNIESSIDLDAYAVYPKSEAINKVGITGVGNFIASATDRANVQLFEGLENELQFKKVLHATNSSLADYKTKGVAEQVRKTIVSSGKVKEFDSFCDKNYGNGLTVEALDSALTFDTGKIYSALGIDKPVTHFKPILQSMLNSGDSAFIRLDSNKEVKVCAQKANIFSAMFKAIPNIETIKNGLARDGYTIQDLQQGMTVALDSEVLGAIMNSAMDFCPVEEKSYLSNLNAKSLIGSAVGKELVKFGINDTNRAFTKMNVLTVD